MPVFEHVQVDVDGQRAELLVSEPFSDQTSKVLSIWDKRNGFLTRSCFVSPQPSLSSNCRDTSSTCAGLSP